MRTKQFLAAFAALGIAGAVLHAAVVRAPGEKIVSFAADITVRPDTTLDVREEFVVRSEASYFKYGLIRYLPIASDARWDPRYAREGKTDTGILVKILEVTEGGAPVSYDQGGGGAYAQLRIGPEDVPVPRGEHRFVLRYEAEGVLRLLADRDELYWNVLGHYWQLPVDATTVRVHLPAGLPLESVRADAYAGGRGVSNPRRPETELLREDSPGAIACRATNLGPAQSLSIVLSWPKGFVAPPKMGALARDRWLLGAPAVLFFYYLIVWIRLGRDPKPGSVVARYEAPEGLSPAAVRYVRTTGSDGRTLAAVIAELSARGCVRIEPQDTKYILTQQKVDADRVKTLAPEELRTLEMLFRDGPSITLNPGQAAQLNVYLMAIQGELQKRLEGVYFTRHIGYIVLGTLASLMAALGSALMARGRDTSGVLFLTWWFFFCAMILGAMLLITVLPAVKRALLGMGGGKQLLVGFGVIGAFGAVMIYLLRMLATNVSPAFTLALASLVLVNLAWAPALKRLTARGRQALDDIEGFRQFLVKVEQDRMQRLNAADQAPKAAVEFLAYAIALEVREAWGDHLAEAFFATTTSR